MKRSNEMSVPNPAKGTPPIIQIPSSTKIDVNEIEEKINPTQNIEFKALSEWANIPLSANSNTGLNLLFDLPEILGGRSI